MVLSNDLVSQFAKLTANDKRGKGESTVYGTVVEHDGSKYVKLDGSDLLTPVEATTNFENDERVTVMIKNHTATVTGNITSPSARTDEVREIGNAITEFEIVIAGKVDTVELTAQVARIDTLAADNVTIKETLNVHKANIDDLEAKKATITELTAAEADIAKLEAQNVTITGRLDAADAEIDVLQSDTILVKKDLVAHKATIDTLTSDNVVIKESLVANEANIEKLFTNKLDANSAEIKYANIDFANIGEAALRKIFSEFGIIKDLVVENGTIVTGELVGVTIKGDLIEGGTVVADKLVVKGSDGLYYKLNTDGVSVETEQTEYNSLSGSVITAKSITASKISVTDLVAFGATIGNFNIRDKSIHSGVKTSATNTTQGVFLGSENGEFAVGDSTNYFRYFKDTDGSFRLELSASLIKMGGSDTTLVDNIEAAQGTANEAQSSANVANDRVGNAELLINSIAAQISTLVVDANGQSLMTQTSDGWSFSMGNIQSSVNSISQTLNDLSGSLGSTSAVVNSLKQAVDDLENTAEYVQVTSYEDEPCIALGESDSDFKLLITNTRIMFMYGSEVKTYVNTTGLVTESIEVERDIKQDYFVTSVRENGNRGTRWTGGENLLLSSKTESSNNDYLLAAYDPEVPLVAGDTYTCSICITPAAGVSHFSPLSSKGWVWLTYLYPSGTARQILTGTFTCRYYDGMSPSDDIANAQIRIYRFPDDGTVTSNSTIHWIKIEKGSTATPWCPHKNDVG